MSKMKLTRVTAWLLLTWVHLLRAQSLFAVLEQGNLTEFNATLSSFPDIVARISDVGNVTVLAPANDAFASWRSTSVGQAAAEDSNLMRAILTYHILRGSWASITTTAVIPSLLNDSYYTNVTTGQVVGAGRFLTETLFVSGLNSNLTATEQPLAFDGGVIYATNNFLTLPEETTTTAVATTNATRFADNVRSAGLADIVNYGANSTIFVPINSGFDVLNSYLSNASATELSSIIAYHVMNGTILYQTLSTFFETPSYLGTDYNLTIRQVGNTYFVNNARIIVADILTANGVIHILDEVLNPNNRTITDRSASDYGLPAFTTAYEATSQNTTNSTDSTDPTGSSNPISHPSSRAGAIAGGVVGGIACVALICAAVWFFRRKGYKVKLEKSGAAPTVRLESDSNERFEMPGGKQTHSHEVSSDEKRLFEVPEESERRAELEAKTIEPVELDANSYEERTHVKGNDALFNDSSDGRAAK